MRTAILVSVIPLVAMATALAAGPSPKSGAVPRDDAFALARAGLIGNIAATDDPEGSHKRYLLAGAKQFYTLWARDFSMASAGALDIGETQAVHDSLDLLLTNERSDGLLPRLIDHENNIVRMLASEVGLRLPFIYPLHVNFDSENAVYSIDGNALIPWAASHYLEVTGDLDAASRWWPKMEGALQFLKANYMVDGLIGKQKPYTDWEDSVARTGRVAFTNELYLLALKGAVSWARLLGMEDRAKAYEEEARDFQKRFHDFFWVPERKMLLNFEGDKRFLLTADANLTAVAYGLVSGEEARAIMETLRASRLWSPMPGRVTWPNFKIAQKDPYVLAFGMGDYHDAMYWLWITSLASQAERAVGNVEGCEKILDDLSTLIVKHQGVHEVYHLHHDGEKLTPIRRLFYRAEHPFTWSSGMFLHAMTQGCR